MTKATHALDPAACSAIVPSPVGNLHLAAVDAGLTHVLFTDETARPPRRTGAARRIVKAAADQLAAYFAGRRRDFDLPLAPRGTAFQLAVWEALRGIPYGHTVSYAEIARRIGNPRAVRAVGLANGANPISIVVPCHRVIGADGRLTGYGGGLPAKKRLLELEGAAGQLPLVI